MPFIYTINQFAFFRQLYITRTGNYHGIPNAQILVGPNNTNNNRIYARTVEEILIYINDS